jgi:DNA glycosylase AlkZ-like
MAAALSQRALNRALLARQGLLERAADPIPRLLERMAGLQAQYAPSMYIGLCSRLEGFARDDLTRALEERSVVQATLMRSTIHLVSREDYWPLTIAVREARRVSWLRASKADPPAEAAARVRDALAGGATMRRKDIEALVGSEPARMVGLWVDLVRAPPSGTWERRRADLYALAEDWIGPPPELSLDAAQDHLVTRYLAGFGPATAKDVVSFTGLPPREVDAALNRLDLTRDGDLLDVRGSPRPDPETPAPPRFLGTWDASLLVHARRTGFLPEEHRPRIFGTKTPQSFPTFTLDGVVAGTWRYDAGRIALSPFKPPGNADRAALEVEADRLATLHA